MKELLRKISNWYFSRKALPYWCILVMDCMAVYVSGLFVYYLQHGGLELAQYFWQVTFGLGLFKCVINSNRIDWIRLLSKPVHGLCHTVEEESLRFLLVTMTMGRGHQFLSLGHGES